MTVSATERVRLWRIANPGRRKEQDAKYRSRHKERIFARQKEWAEENTESCRMSARGYLGKKIGWTEDRFNSMWIEQSGRCAICAISLLGRGQKHNSATRDHCHDCGAPRKILCQSCNTCLGHYEKFSRPVGFRLNEYELYLLSCQCPRPDQSRQR